MTEQYREFPENWASDGPTQFIDLACNNVVATFVQDKEEYPLVRNIDGFYYSIVKHLIDPEGILEAILIMRCHAAFRASFLLGMSGMAPETFVQVRSCLENALYALHINKNPGHDEVWANRHKDDASLKQVKDKFRMVDVMTTLENTDPANHKVAKLLYERTIDFGAHPNERAATSSLIIEERDGSKKIKQNYLAGGTLQQRHAMKTVAQVGLCALYVFREIFTKKFDILGVTNEMDKHRNIL